MTLGALALWNSLRALSSGVDVNIWWVDLRILPLGARSALLGICGALLAWTAVRPTAPRPLRRAAQIACGLLLVISLANTGVFWYLLATGAIQSDLPIPVSLLVGLALGVVLWTQRQPEITRARPLTAATSLLVLAGLIPLAHMLCFGLTDYRRPADAVVVFGAGVGADGVPSQALADRMRTAVDLYHSTGATWLIVSGGPGPGATHETDAMRRYALTQGVPADQVIVDPQGLCTRDTARNTRELFRRHNIRSILAVSHFYHLARAKLAYQQAGVEVCTSPARQQYILTRTPYYMAREALALWAYYLMD